MFDCRQDERTFWKTMNPRRLHALFNSYFKPAKKTVEKMETPNAKPTRFVDLDVPAGNQKSLAQYFMGR